MDAPTATSFCCELSQASGESIAASATAETHVWLLLEYAGAWGRKAFPDSSLPPPVKDALQRAADHVPGARIQLIRRSGDKPSTRSFFVARSSERPFVRRFALGQYEDVLGLDLERAVAGTEGGELVEGPLFLVCTNGKRDACCAKFGLPIYDKLVELGAPVWQTSHIGGHRFAPTLLCLPHGLCYGRFGEADLEALVAATQRGEVWDLDRYRGRTWYAPHVQAAERFVREQTGTLAVEAVQIAGVDALGEGRWRVRAQVDGSAHAVEIVEQRLEGERPRSCGDELKPIVTFAARAI